MYDMLSIRREIKKDLKGLVKTNITSNAKSHLIIKKLIDFANEREMGMVKEMNVSEVVVRIQPHRMCEGQEDSPHSEAMPTLEIKASHS